MIPSFKKIFNKITGIYYYIGNNCFSNLINMRSIKYNKKVYIFTFAWGEHLDWYFKYVLPALMNKTNTGALAKDGFDVHYVLYTTDEKDKVMEKYNNNSNFQYIELIVFNKGNSTETRKIAVYPILDILKRGINEKAMLYQACADQVIGNSSLYNSVVTSYGKNKCFAFGNGRVSLDVLDDITPYPSEGIENSELVSLCMKYPHDALKDANEDLDKNNTIDGVSFRKISSNLYSVTHNMPSPVVVFPIQEDYEYFKKVNDYNQWDRGWVELLIRSGRLKVSGSSDLFFFMELTTGRLDMNQVLPNRRYNDEIPNPGICHRVSNIFISVWRSSE